MAGARRWTGTRLTRRAAATGLLGGSFNPAHGGHRAISLLAIDALALDELWWLVSPGNPLKSGKNMAPLPARLASAQQMARRSKIKASAIETVLGTRYTIDTLRALTRRYPNRRFIWIMGADNLRNFHQWKQYRDIARILPIAVIARPGYGKRVVASRAMAWLRRFVRPASQRYRWTDWSLPALTFLRFTPDFRSATAVRSANPDWYRASLSLPFRDPLTRRLITPENPETQEHS
ncbi:MAG: nicotinate-nucleotide adenylyltransferase [Parasphingorhabdus sp.]|nr:nicotinate-nucleotide adenylyltransferase [Parasphingorhabdus sp.]